MPSKIVQQFSLPCNWLISSAFQDSKIATIDFGHCDGSKAVGITEVGESLGCGAFNCVRCLHMLASFWCIELSVLFAYAYEFCL